VSIDVIGNFLTCLRNGALASKQAVAVPYSIVKYAIAKILKDEGFIRDIEVVDNGNNKKTIKISLKYIDGESVIHEITRLSKPGRRLYAKVGGVKPVIGNLGISILSTNKGIMTNKAAKDHSVGGEIICSVW
jgi:small subunit ribosomal protein S8